MLIRDFPYLKALMAKKSKNSGAGASGLQVENPFEKRLKNNT
jgi:hypothetical protein